MGLKRWSFSKYQNEILEHQSGELVKYEDYEKLLDSIVVLSGYSSHKSDCRVIYLGGECTCGLSKELRVIQGLLK